MPLENSCSHQASISEGSGSSNFEVPIDGAGINDDIVLSSSVPTPQSQPPSNAEQNHSTNSINDDKELDEEEEIVVLPSSPSQFQEDGQITDNNNSDTRQGRLRCDIHEQSMRSIRNAMNKNVSSASSLSSPKSCPICMEPYKAGDEIAWSKNESCAHAFHLDCIASWLMRNDDCPMCRQDYLCNESNEV